MPHRLALGLSLFLALSILPTSGMGLEYAKGDVDGNGVRNAADLLLLTRHVEGTLTVPLTAPQLAAADVAPWDGIQLTPDGAIDGGDVTVLSRIIVGEMPVAAVPEFTVPQAPASPDDENPVSFVVTADKGALIKVYVNGRLRWSGRADAVTGTVVAQAYLFDGPGVAGADTNLISVSAELDGFAPSLSDGQVKPFDMDESYKSRTSPITVAAGTTLVLTPGDGTPYQLPNPAQACSGAVSPNRVSVRVDDGGTLVVERGTIFNVGTDPCAGILVSSGGTLRVFGEEGARVAMNGAYAGPAGPAYSGIRVENDIDAWVEGLDLRSWLIHLSASGWGTLDIHDVTTGLAPGLVTRASNGFSISQTGPELALGVTRNTIDAATTGLLLDGVVDDATVTLNTITTATRGLEIVNSVVLLEENTIGPPAMTGDPVGILVNTSSATLRDNVVTGAGSGIRWSKCLSVTGANTDSVVVENNLFDSCVFGFSLENNAAHVIRENDFLDTQTAAMLTADSAALVNRNTFEWSSSSVFLRDAGNQNPINGPVDLRENYWSVADVDQVPATVGAAHPDESSVNFSGYLLADGEPTPPTGARPLGYPPYTSFLDLQTGSPGAEIFPAGGGKLTIDYFAWKDVEVELYVYRAGFDLTDFDFGTTTLTPVVRLVPHKDSPATTELKAASATPYSVEWDGKLADGTLAGDGLYFVSGRFQVASTTTEDVWEPTIELIDSPPTNSSVISPQHNVYRNGMVRVHADYGPPAVPSVPRTIRVTAHDGIANPSGANYVHGFYQLKGEGGATDLHIGLRDADDGMFMPSLADANVIGIWVRDPYEFQSYAVLVRGSTPTVEGPEVEVDTGIVWTPQSPEPEDPPALPPAVEVKADPFLVHRSYDETTTLLYCLDQTAAVSAQVLRGSCGDPDAACAEEVATLVDPHNPAGPIALDDVVPTAVPNGAGVCRNGMTLYEAILDDVGAPPDADSRVHSFVLRASRQNNPDASRVVRGVIQMYE